MKFRRLVIDNFGSWKHLELSLQDRGLVYIQGDNGVGKSSIFNAILWALMGDEGKPIPADAVVNKFAGRGCRVCVELSEAGAKYTVIRGRKPNFLKLVKDGKDVSQKSVRATESLIQSELRFSPVPLKIGLLVTNNHDSRFLALSPASRKKVLEQFYSSEWIEACIAESKELSKRYLQSIASVEGSLATLSEVINREKGKCVEVLDEVGLKRKLDVVESKASRIDSAIRKSGGLRDHLMKSLGSCRASVKRLVESLDRLSGQSSCPLCFRPLTSVQATKLVNLLTSKLDFVKEKEVVLEKELRSVEQELRELEDQLEEVVEEKQSLLMKLAQLESNKSFLEKQKVDLKKLSKKFESLTRRKSELDSKLALVELCRAEVFPAILELFYRKVVSQLNVLLERNTRYYGDLSVRLALEDGNIVEKLQYAGGDTYGELSDGEKCLVDLACVLAFRCLALSNRCNLLLLDEVFGRLDIGRIQQVLNLLRSMDFETILVVSHRKELRQFFDHVWEVRKDKYSQLVELS